MMEITESERRNVFELYSLFTEVGIIRIVQFYRS